MTGGPIGVAIVDDDPGFAATLAELLRLEPGLHVIGIAQSVEQGIELLADRRVHLALVDVHMPDGGGIRLVEEVRSWENPPTLALISANPPTQRTHETGVEFISKHDLGADTLRRVAGQTARM